MLLMMATFHVPVVAIVAVMPTSGIKSEGDATFLFRWQLLPSLCNNLFSKKGHCPSWEADSRSVTSLFVVYRTWWYSYRVHTNSCPQASWHQQRAHKNSALDINTFLSIHLNVILPYTPNSPWSPLHVMRITCVHVITPCEVRWPPGAGVFTN